MRHTFIRSFGYLCFILVLSVCILHPCRADLQGDVSGNTDPSRAGIEKLLQDLEDPHKLEILKQDLQVLLRAGEASPEKTAAETKGFAGQLLVTMSGYTQQINHVLAEVGQNMLQIPGLARQVAGKARDPEIRGRWGEMGSKVILVLLAGFLAQLLVSRLLSRARASLEDRDTYSKAFRIVLTSGSTLLELIPIAAFAAAAYGLLPLLEPREGTRLMALTLINASVLVRAVMAFTRLLLMPGAPSLRLLPIDSESVQYLYIWVRRIVRTSVYGFFILEALLILGLAVSLYLFFLKMLGLIIALMVIILVLQNRADVARWLRRDQKLTETPAAHSQKIQTATALRRRFADFWHIAAILLTLGIFGTWALEIQGGIFFLVRALVLTVMVAALTAFLVRISQRGLDQLFKISPELKKNYPNLEARANRYLPLLRHTVKGALYIVSAFSIMQAWGIGTYSWILSPQGGAIVSKLLVIILIVGGAFLFWELASLKIEAYMTREREGAAGRTANKRILTLLPLLNNVIRITLVLVAGMSVLSHIGINIAPLLAGAGVVGLAVGFGAQTLVRDVITGAFILMEDSISVGDWVEAGGYAGTVEKLTIRTLTLRDLTGAVFVIPFGEVTTVKNSNRDFGFALVDAGVAYREDYGEVVQALQDVATALQQDDVWGPDIIGDLELFGLNNLGDSAVEVRVRLKTRPMRQFAVRRAFLEKMKRIFDERGIEIPFPHQTIWFGEDKKGAAPPMRLLKASHPATSHQQAVASTPNKDHPEIEMTHFSESEASGEVVDTLADTERDPDENNRTKP
ncbi:MAG: mechanosensitive ion channel [Desulfotignum sp.]|nr:mechanosensitive ion channel [Desulfotignum sp.]MCF8089723.1 mechanosensitive ion channel [Desulfotignum sp.]MCF8137301.1 mechanosensitive ion channel [Desulfotignum sp.]